MMTKTTQVNSSRRHLLVLHGIILLWLQSTLCTASPQPHPAKQTLQQESSHHQEHTTAESVNARRKESIQKRDTPQVDKFQSTSEGDDDRRRTAHHSTTTATTTTASTVFTTSFPISPFQIYLVYDGEYDNAMTNTDEMMLLQSTQSYLSGVLKGTEPFFARLELYQFVRDFPVNDNKQPHFAKIAFRGMAHFEDGNMTMQDEKMESEVMLSLVGTNMTNFVKVLRKTGMSNLKSVTLMSIDGRMMDYRDGELIYMDTKDSSSTPEDSMTMQRSQMKTMTLLLCVGIPGFVLASTIGLFVSRWIRNVGWQFPEELNSKAPSWRTSNHLETVPVDDMIEGATIKHSNTGRA